MRNVHVILAKNIRREPQGKKRLRQVKAETKLKLAYDERGKSTLKAGKMNMKDITEQSVGKNESEREKEELHTSLGHLIRPICLRTRRSLSLSLWMSSVWPSLPEGWKRNKHNVTLARSTAYPPTLTFKWWWKCVFHHACSHCARIIKWFHSETVTQGMFMTTVKLVFPLKCGPVPNHSQDQNNRWQNCQGGRKNKSLLQRVKLQANHSLLVFNETKHQLSVKVRRGC